MFLSLFSDIPIHNLMTDVRNRLLQDDTGKTYNAQYKQNIAEHQRNMQKMREEIIERQREVERVKEAVRMQEMLVGAGEGTENTCGHE